MHVWVHVCMYMRVCMRPCVHLDMHAHLRVCMTVCVHAYLEGREVEQCEAVEEANALQSHLDDPGGVRLLGALAGAVRRVGVQQDAVERVDHAHQLCGLQQRRQPRGVLPLVVEYTAGAGEGIRCDTGGGTGEGIRCDTVGH